MSSKKRKGSGAESCFKDGLFPEHPLFSLSDAEIESSVRDLCDSVIAKLEKYATIDDKIERLVLSAKKARRLPRLEQVNLAVLGEQGVGKSSLVNALLDRKLLDRSGGRRACTAFATVIEYRDGADDNTKESNIKIKFQDFGTIKENIREQMQRWTDVYPGQIDGEQDDETNIASADQDEIEIKEEPMDESWVEENGAQDSPKVSRALRRAADTAKDFFAVIFDTPNDPAMQVWLEELMINNDIRETDFFERCCRQIKTRLDHIRQYLGMQDDSFVYSETNVADKTLGERINIAKSVWPFVKEFTIATGHVLLRYGIRFFDVPGYGDSSNLRRAVINEFRWKADVEMIVAPASRLQTSTIQQDYIDLSLGFKKKNKPILVMNKVDSLINPDDVAHIASQITEEPFPTLCNNLADIDEILSSDSEDDGYEFEAAKEAIEKEIIEAYIAREVRLAKEEMGSKDIEIFGTSAAQWMAYLNPRRRRDPSLSREVTGVQQLRQYLLTLTADTVLKMMRNHVFKTLDTVRQSADHIQARFQEDQSYAAMREDLRRQIPALGSALCVTASYKRSDIIVSPWTDAERENIIGTISSVINNSWIQSRISYATFAKMLRENGIPVNGKFFGWNLNREILPKMKSSVDKWRDDMARGVLTLSRALINPVESMLNNIQESIKKSSAMQELKDTASVALQNAVNDVAHAGSSLTISLQSSVKETHLRFTTEIDISCPVATAMSPVYARALDPNVVGCGKGKYTRQREALCNTLQNPPRESQQMLDSFANALTSRLDEMWWDRCDQFIDQVTNTLENFSRICEDLLLDVVRTSDQHKKARGEIAEVFKTFDIKWEQLKSVFDAGEDQPRKRARQNESMHGIVEHATSERLSQD